MTVFCGDLTIEGEHAQAERSLRALSRYSHSLYRNVGHHSPEPSVRIAYLSAALAVGLATACAPAHMVSTPAPTPVAGDRIRYADRSDTTSFLTVRLISLDADSLVFERFTAGDARRWITGSLATDSIARLQVRVGRRGNAGRGALIGGLVGGVLGIACASEESGWLTPTPGECLLGYTLTGAGTGLLVGAFVRSDVWAPGALPTRRLEQPPAPAPVSATPVGIGIRLPIRLASP